VRLNFFVNADEIVKELNNFKEEAKAALEAGVKSVAAITHAKVTELASNKLNSTRKIYLDNLDFQEIMPQVWVVSLDQPALWIEEGRKAGDMTEDLLKNGAKTSKEGHRYKAIPFDHGKPSTQMNPFGKNMVSLIKKVLKKEGATMKGIQYNKDGSPRLGKIATYHIDSPKPSARASTPALFGLNVYQTLQENGKVRRDIVTFRMVSDKHKGNKWIHPGREAEKFFEQALQWADRVWETEVLPDILRRFE